jgi:hypothetical protein
VSLAADRPDATYAIGETVKFTVSASEDAYVTVLDVGPTGQVVQLFPNQYQTDNHVFANRPVEIGGGNSGAKVKVAGPVGTELIKIIASSKPMTVVSEAQLQGHGLFRSIDGGAQTVLRDLQVAADQTEGQSDTKVALVNFALHTVSSRVPAAPALIIVPSQAQAPVPAATTLLPVVFPQPPAPAPAPAPARVSIPAPQPFPLLVAVDRPSYRVGEKVALAVTTTQTCNLTVLELSASGQMRTLFPNETTPNNAVGGLQTVLVAGGPSAVSIRAAGPAGTEQILAICSADAAPMIMAANAGGDHAALMGDLALVSSRPAGATAMANVTFAVQP